MYVCWLQFKYICPSVWREPLKDKQQGLDDTGLLFVLELIFFVCVVLHATNEMPPQQSATQSNPRAQKKNVDVTQQCAIYGSNNECRCP